MMTQASMFWTKKGGGGSLFLPLLWNRKIPSARPGRLRLFSENEFRVFTVNVYHANNAWLFEYLGKLGGVQKLIYLLFLRWNIPKKANATPEHDFVCYIFSSSANKMGIERINLLVFLEFGFLTDIHSIEKIRAVSYQNPKICHSNLYHLNASKRASHLIFFLTWRSSSQIGWNRSNAKVWMNPFTCAGIYRKFNGSHNQRTSLLVMYILLT